MSQTISKANESDVPDLMALYKSVYGDKYPVIYGTDPVEALKMIKSEKDLWYVIRDPVTLVPVASAIVNVDCDVKIGQVIAVAVHPNFSGQGLATQLVSALCEDIFKSKNPPNSLFATTRTVSMGPQKVFLKNNFLPMGFLPNSHFINGFESLTLFVRYREEAINAKDTTVQSEQLKKLQRLIEERTFQPVQSCELEFLESKEAVFQQFSKAFKNPYDRYYPFHQPNFLVTSIQKGSEIYLNVSHKDRYSALIAGTSPWYQLKSELAGLFSVMERSEISYIEVLVPFNDKKSLATLMEFGFAPCAIYPKMMMDLNNHYSDFVFLSKSFKYFDVTKIQVDRVFQPYVENYRKSPFAVQGAHLEI